MSRLFNICLALSLCTLFQVGCDNKEVIRSETEINTPNRKTTITREKEIERKGQPRPMSRMAR